MTGILSSAAPSFTALFERTKYERYPGLSERPHRNRRKPCQGDVAARVQPCHVCPDLLGLLRHGRRCLLYEHHVVCAHDDERRRLAAGLWLVYFDHRRHGHDVGRCQQTVRGPVPRGLRDLCEHLWPDRVVWPCQLRPAHHQHRLYRHRCHHLCLWRAWA